MVFYPELPSVAPTRFKADHEVIGELVGMVRRARARRAVTARRRSEAAAAMASDREDIDRSIARWGFLVF